jgi:hypothetical protein
MTRHLPPEPAAPRSYLLPILAAVTIVVGTLGAFGLRQPTGATAETPASPVRVEVTSEPAGALVVIDGEERGHTPVEIEVQAGATVHALVRKEGFRESAVDLQGDESADTASVTLEPVPYVLAVRAPDQCSVEVDGRAVENPSEIDLGQLEAPVTVVIRGRGLRAVTETVALDRSPLGAARRLAELVVDPPAARPQVRSPLAEANESTDAVPGNPFL